MPDKPMSAIDSLADADTDPLAGLPQAIRDAAKEINTRGKKETAEFYPGGWALGIRPVAKTIMAHIEPLIVAKDAEIERLTEANSALRRLQQVVIAKYREAAYRADAAERRLEAAEAIVRIIVKNRRNVQSVIGYPLGLRIKEWQAASGGEGDDAQRE